MKKVYKKHTVLCQQLQPETMICGGCVFTNPTYNEVEQCGFSDEDMGFKIFASTWIDCDIPDITELYCYHNSQLNIFGS